MCPNRTDREIKEIWEQTILPDLPELRVGMLNSSELRCRTSPRRANRVMLKPPQHAVGLCGRRHDGDSSAGSPGFRCCRSRRVELWFVKIDRICWPAASHHD
jgi:hypothetical protein